MTTSSLFKNAFNATALLAIACSLFFAQAAVAEQTISVWDIGAPIIHAYGAVDLDTTLARQAVEGGYNVVYVTAATPSSLAGQLAIAEQYGLRTKLYSSLLSPSTLNDSAKLAELNALIDQYKQSPSAYCYQVKDEPNASEFTELGNFVSYLRNRDPEHLAYINLLPTYAENSQLGTTSYQKYLSQYINTVQPGLLSYDHYNLLLDDSDRSDYLLNLQLVASAAKQAGIPFMNIVQASDGAVPEAYRVPTENELRFLAYSTMAYGAQAISYYRWQRPSGYGGLWDGNRIRTSLYYALQPINGEFEQIVEEYQSLEWIGTYMKGYYSISKPDGTTLLPGDSPLSVSGVTNRFYSDGDPLKGILMGFFGEGDTLYDATHALVVNLDYSDNKTATITGSENLSIFDAAAGLWTATGMSQISLDLAPGGGVFIALTSAVPEPSVFVLLIIGSLGVCIRKSRSL